MRRFLFLVAALGLMAWAVAFFLSLSQTHSENDPLPTLMVLPSLTPKECHKTRRYTSDLSGKSCFSLRETPLSGADSSSKRWHY